jgi:general secretion pathway protein D
MNQRSLIKAFAAALAATLLAACSTMPAPQVSREGARTEVPNAGQAGTAGAGPVTAQTLPDAEAGLPQAQIRRGTGQTINSAVAASAPPNLVGTTGETTFNFEGESLQAVVKAILGDMLGQNYVIAPGVQGTVTYVTSKPVSPAEALSLLEMVLGWNNARMIYSDGRYNIVPADTAMATGAVAPRTGSPVNARGF